MARLNWLGLSPAMQAGLILAAREGDVLHTNAMWNLPALYPYLGSAIHRCPTIVSPRGCLDPWALKHHGYRKRLIWYAWQRRILERATCLHATAPMELEYFRELGLKTPIANIPNGVNVPDLLPRQNNVSRRLLFLARIHPKKGVDILLHAWNNVAGMFTDWDLHIVGPGPDYIQTMQTLANELNLPRVTFVGPIPEADKAAYFQGSDLYVLPTHTDNWAMSVSEALANGVPAIVSKGAPWQGLENHRCGWWIDNTVQALSDCLEGAMSMSTEQLSGMGVKGREWMLHEYSWTAVASKMLATYQWMVEGHSPPQWVEF